MSSTASNGRETASGGVEASAPAAEPVEPVVRPLRMVERARWSDVHGASIVCYDAFLRFFDRIESELFHQVGFPASVLRRDHGIRLVRRRVEGDFVRPIHMDEEVELFAYVPGIGRSSIEVGFFARRLGAQEIAAESHYVVVTVDEEHFRPARLPDAFRVALGGYEMDRDSALAAIG